MSFLLERTRLQRKLWEVTPGGRGWPTSAARVGSEGARNNIPVLLLWTDVAASSRLQKKKKGNTIQPWFVWPESLRIGFEANYFRVAEAAENSGTGGSCGLWQLEISETLLWGERGVELGSGGDLKPKTRSQRWRRWGEGSSSRREFPK